MLNIENFFAEKPVPDWFKNHPVFKEIKEVNKIFPSIGLPNFSTTSTLENNEITSTIKQLHRDITQALNSAIYYFSNEKITTAKTTLAISLLKQFKRACGVKSFITQFKTKKNIYLSKSVFDANKNIFVKENEGLFKAYGKLTNFFSKNYNYHLPNLDSLNSFKNYNSYNINGNLKIVFSSDGIDGAWDILTMSQRGINSCQSWHGQYKNCTIGSVVDPYTAIMYLTSNTETQYGSKMIRRCVVRFVVDSFIKKPCLYLEYMYPNQHAETMRAFKKALQAKIGDRFPIIISRNPYKLYVPYSKTTDLLIKHGDSYYANRRGYHNQYNILPYRDTFMEYKIKSEKSSLLCKLESEKTTIQNLMITELSTTQLSRKYINEIINSLNKEIFDKINLDSYQSIKDYRRKLYINYFAKKYSIQNSILQHLKSSLKIHKDKSINVPGLKRTKSKITKAANSVKTKTLIPESTKNDIERIITSNFKKLINS